MSGVPIEQGYIKPQKKEPQTLRWLVSQYRKSSHWASLRLNTRKWMDVYLEQATQNSGNVDYKKITSKHISNALEDRKNKIGASLNFFRAMQGLFKWAMKHEYITINPCLGVEKPNIKTDGHKPWTIEDMRSFRQFWAEGTPQRLAFEFLLYTGLRVSDACRAGYQHLKGNIFSIKNKK